MVAPPSALTSSNGEGPPAATNTSAYLRLAPTHAPGGSDEASARSPTESEQVVAHLRAGIRSCYNGELSVNPTAKGPTKLSITWAKNGAVGNIVIGGDVSVALRKCLKGAILAMPAVPSDEGITLAIPLNSDDTQ